MPIKLFKSEFVNFQTMSLFMVFNTQLYILKFQYSVILITFMWPIKLFYEARMSNKMLSLCSDLTNAKILINMHLIMSKYISKFK